MSGPETIETKTETPGWLDVTKNYRDALEGIREGVLDMARGLKRGDVDPVVADGLVNVMAGLRDLEFLDDDIRRFEQAWCERSSELRAARKAEEEAMLDSSLKTTADLYAEKHGLVLVPKQAKRAASRRRAA